ncbi:hypothetical protein P7C73_g2930, partial [Tremellales sp. Uapishka_1]
MDDMTLEDSPPIMPPPETPLPGGAHSPGDRPRGNDEPRKLSRFLPALKDEAFIGVLPSSHSDTIKLVQRECPSLAVLPPSDISLKLRFDGDKHAVNDVKFRVLDEAWPAAISDVLPLVHVETRSKQSVPTAPKEKAIVLTVHGRKKDAQKAVEQLAAKGETWNDLVKRGALLGVEGQIEESARRAAGNRKQ